MRTVASSLWPSPLETSVARASQRSLVHRGLCAAVSHTQTLSSVSRAAQRLSYPILFSVRSYIAKEVHDRARTTMRRSRVVAMLAAVLCMCGPRAAPAQRRAGPYRPRRNVYSRSLTSVGSFPLRRLLLGLAGASRMGVFGDADSRDAIAAQGPLEDALRFRGRALMEYKASCRGTRRAPRGRPCSPPAPLPRWAARDDSRDLRPQAPSYRWPYKQRYDPRTGKHYQGGFVNPFDSSANGSLSDQNSASYKYLVSTAALGLPFFALMIIFFIFYLIFGLVRFIVSCRQTAACMVAHVTRRELCREARAALPRRSAAAAARAAARAPRRAATARLTGGWCAVSSRPSRWPS